MNALDDLPDQLLAPLGVIAADLAGEHAGVGDDVMGPPPPIEAMLTVLCSSTRPAGSEAIARAAATIALRPSSGRMAACAAAPWKRASRRKWLGERVITSPIGEGGRTRTRSGCAAARRRRRRAGERALLADREQQLELDGRALRVQLAGERGPRPRRPCCRRRGSSLAFSQTPSLSIGSTGACRGTVSRCAHIRTERTRLSARACAAGGSRARRLPQSEPVSSPARSSSVSMPSPRSSALTRSAQRRSHPEGLSIRHSSANVPLR